ncbi:MAG TPA: acyl carrier protein [Actinophytocola sp.]|uniref:acyl carrier protein n=1 Tax=Actinophytocola sp. TaxID=1872138 RepID=UPI002DDD5733|nr:acyl carrier protein [Actinophytocola sp.]HEV2778125.1 acyl carrier protein [Actinophytocola sp.]
MNPIEEIAGWIISRHPRVEHIDPDHDLIDNRLIDSMSFVECIMLIERLSGRQVDLDQLDLDSFRTLRSIQRSFFTERAA